MSVIDKDNMWPDLPIEFNVVGTPVSFQSANARAKDEWKGRVLAAAMAAVGEGHWAFDKTRLSVTMLYFPTAPMVGDVDNIVKLVIDALIPNIYLDDELVDRVLVQRFDPTGMGTFTSPSEALIAAMTMDEPVLYVRVEEVDLEGIVT